MNGRERLTAALSHRRPDRTPIDLGGTRDSSIVIEGYERLKEHFGVQEENRLTSRMMQVVDVNENILKELDIDTRGVFPMTPPDTETGERNYLDEWGVERVRPPGSYYYDQIKFPLSGEITVSDITRYPWPDPTDPVRRMGLKDRVRWIRDNTGCAAVLNLQSAFVHTSQYLRGFEDWFVDLAGDMRLIEVLFDAVLDISLGICRELLEEIGQEVDVVMASDDLGLQDGLMVSPDLYRKLFFPRHGKYFRLIHDLSPAKVLFHSCGSIVDILDDLIEIGVDAVNPVQVSARGMEPGELMKKYHGRLAFWGAVDTHNVLPRGNTADVKNEVEKRIDELGTDGGYVLGAVHNIQPDVPLDNILTMFRHAKEYTSDQTGEKRDETAEERRSSPNS